MDEFRWIQMFSCLMLMIQTVAVSVNETAIFMCVKVEDDVTLPCLNVIDDQNNCDGTAWNFTSRNKQTVEVFELLQIDRKAKTKSDRLSVPANCSLVIKKVTVEDVGHYTCQQYNIGQTRSQKSLVHQTLVELSVVTVTKHEDADKVTFNCSVLTNGECHHTVKWLIKAGDFDKENKEIQISQTNCSTTGSLAKSHFLLKSVNVVKCEVTDTKTGKVQLFTINHQLSGNTKTTRKPRTTIKSSTKSETTTTINSPSKTNIQWYIIAAVGLVSLLVIAVFVIRWRRTKGNNVQIDDNSGLKLNPAETQSAPQTSQDSASSHAAPRAEVDPEVSYATISYTKTNSKVWVQGDDEGDAVTYSTVKTTSSSAAATADPSNL